jgi:hypothetical protein
MHTEQLHIKDLPSATIDSACDDIVQFTVGLQRIVGERGAEDIQLIGTGTLVLINGKRCILTAEHVLAELKPDDRLALLSSFTGALRRHAFDLSHIRIHRIAKGADDSKGPDIGLIVLPEANIGHLLAEKVFFNIDKRRERFAEGFLENDRGFWFTCGIVGESETDLPLQPGFTRIKGYQGLCGASTRPREHEDSGFDYLEVQVDYEPHNPELPWSFGGFSGGGVWQVPLRKIGGGEIEPEECVLSGIVFYQTAVEDGARLLRCHGRKTVYRNVPEFLAQAKGS